MTTRIENNKLVGTEVRNAQLLTNTANMRQYPIKIIMDGCPIDVLVKHAINAAIIVKRKTVKTLEQAEALAKGITFQDMVSAVVKDPNTIAAGLDVDGLDEAMAAELLKKLQSRSTGDQTQIVQEDDSEAE